MTHSSSITRIIIPDKKYRSEELSPGVLFEQLHPGGKDGPNGEVHREVPGGQTWSEFVFLGDQKDAFQLWLPDIRLPPNQYWPLHWHDTWTVVLILEGSCILGDWHMQPGDVFITIPSLEYGPLLIGPTGCRLLEIFAQAHLAPGGYAPEYRDHPTLQGAGAVFLERSELNKRNDGRQMLPLDDVDGILKSRLEPGKIWNLGDENDPDRGVMADTRLPAGQRIPRHRYEDWHCMLVLDGSVSISGKKIAKDGYLLIHPGSVVDTIQAGPQGAHLLELARTARGMERLPES